MLLAEAFDIPYQEFLVVNAGADAGPSLQPAAARFPLRILLVGFALILLGFGIWSLLQLAIRNVDWTIEEGSLRVHDGLLGFKLWERKGNSRISFCRRSPWADDILLVGRYGDFPDGGHLVALAAASGDTIWEIRPHAGPFFAAFDSSMIGSARFNCGKTWVADVDGNGESEVVVYFYHTRYFPSCLCLVDRYGSLMRQYCHRGFLYATCVEDIDGDGKDEVLAGGINNAAPYRGGTIFLLDDAHWGGASVDSLAPPMGAISDSSLVRLVFPRYDDIFMTEIGDLYIGVDELKIHRNDDGDLTIDAALGAHACDLLLVLDSDLHPLSVDIDDSFLQKMKTWPDSLQRIPNPASPIWRQAWLDRHYRYQNDF